MCIRDRRDSFQPRRDSASQCLRRDPAERTEEPAASCRKRFREIKRLRDSRLVLPFESGYGDGEELAGPRRLLKLVPSDAVTVRSGDAKPVQMRLDAFFEAAE